MKKKLFISFVCLTVTVFCFGQSDTILLNKRGKPILPQKGDFAVGISANPIFDYLGNMLSSSGNNGLRTRLLNDNTIFGKYYLSAESAIRLKLSVSSSFNSFSNSVVDDNNALALVVDKKNVTNSTFQIMPGFEKHRGNGRLQVIYGGELLFGFTKNTNKYTYGNKLTETNQDPTSTYDFSYSTTGSRLISRPVEGEGLNNFKFGVKGFLGVEYFFLPKVAIGTEIGLAYAHTSTKNYKNKYQIWDQTKGEISTNTNKGLGIEANSIYIDNLNGSIYILYCF